MFKSKVQRVFRFRNWDKVATFKQVKSSKTEFQISMLEKQT